MEKIDKCPECGSSNLIHDYNSGEIICGDCGLVIQQQEMDKGPEWRAFTQEEKTVKSRVGKPITFSFHDKGLSTAIIPSDRDAWGKKLSPETKTQMWRLRKWQILSSKQSVIEKNLAQAMEELNRLSALINIPRPVKEEASFVYRKAVKKGLVRGRSIFSMIAASLCVACRRTQTLRTLTEIAEASLVDKKEVARNYRLLLEELDYFIPTIKPSQYVTKFSNQLAIHGKTEEIAHKILETAREMRLTSGRDPTGITAAAIYIASVLTGERKTQREIAEIAQVTDVTIRNRYKELVQKLLFVIWI